jgi:hypothetical protein
MTHNLWPFKPITCNLSSEKTGFKVCLSNANLQRYSGGQHRAALASSRKAVSLLESLTVEPSFGGAVRAESIARNESPCLVSLDQ